MAHNARTQLDATWTTGTYVTLASDWSSLGGKVFAAINGDRGGCWAPSAPITLAGTYPTQRILLTGPIVVDYGGSLNVAPGTGTAIFRLAVGDWPKFSASHVLRTRTIVTPCILRQATPLWLWTNDIVYGGAQSIACTVQTSPFFTDFFTGNTVTVSGWDGSKKPSGLLQPGFALPLRVHDGARFVSATLTFRVPSARSAAPFVPPQVRIVQVDTAGNITPLKSVASGANPNGYIPVATPTSGATWFASGGSQSVTYTCDQNQTVDVSKYTYWAQIVEEVGTLSTIPMASCDGALVREKKLAVTATATSHIALTGTVTVDGVSCGAAGSPGYGGTQDRVLATAQNDASQNGIWVTNSAGLWTRAPDMAGVQDCTPGFLVHALKGAANAGVSWECKAPNNTQSAKLSGNGDLTGTAITFQRRQPRGNIYHAVACNFDSIADMRYQ